MPGLLLSGPAGAGKSQSARAALSEANGPAIAVDFQSLYAALLLLERLPNGRYPERESRHIFMLALVEYLRSTAMREATARDIAVVATNSDGSPERRRRLLERLGPGAIERVIDPGRAVVVDRLSVDGSLPAQCGTAINRWYDRLDATT